MRFTHSGFRTFTIGAAFALFASTASPQTPVGPLPEHGRRPHAAPAVDVAAQLAFLDARIAVLRGDMLMFVGELKIQAMASLLDALVERQALTDRDRHTRRGERELKEDETVPLQPAEMEPEAMCSPFI